MKNKFPVIPAQAGILRLNPCFRRDDKPWLQKFIIHSLFVLTLLFSPVTSYSEEPIKLTQQDISLIQQAQDYLYSVKTIKARFLQFNPKSTTASNGELYISKPGKLKMSFFNPYPIDYYINDDDFTQYDRELDQVTRGAAPENPLKVLLYNSINLLDNELLAVTGVVDQGNYFFIYTSAKNKDINEMNAMVLKFSKTPVELAGIQRIDSQKNIVDTTFSYIESNIPLDDAIFIFTKPKSAFPTAK